MSPVVLTTAQCGFEAARHLGSLRALMGHGFSVQAAAVLPSRFQAFPGAEVPTLIEALDACVAPLRQGLLNHRLDEPDDEALARWVLQHLDLPTPGRISVQCNGQQGVHLMPLPGGTLEVQHWRRYAFHSAHRLPNVRPGHKCGRMHGHSFSTIVQATDRPSDIDAAWAPLHMALNYACLNDLPGLDNPTSERLALWLKERLAAGLDGLRCVTVFETASCGAHVDRRGLRIWKDFSFDSATRLRSAPPGSPRGGLHGYTYTLRLHLQAPLDPQLGWAVDFGEVKDRFKPLFDTLDHHRLDELPGLEDGDCASVAGWVYEHAMALLPSLYRVDVYETPGCGSVLMPAGPEAPILPGPTF